MPLETVGTAEKSLGPTPWDCKAGEPFLPKFSNTDLISPTWLVVLQRLPTSGYLDCSLCQKTEPQFLPLQNGENELKKCT